VLPELTWLQLSGFIFHAERSSDHEIVLTSLIRDVIETMPQQELSPDVVFITGDIAYTGRAEEYRQARDFFEVLAERLGHEPEKQWFVAPGNHDVDRSRIKPLDLAMRGSLHHNSRGEILEDPEAWERFSARQRDFLSFTRELLGGHREWQAQSPWQTTRLKIRGEDIAVLCLNSAWSCQADDDRGKLLLGEPQVRQALTEANGASLKVALMHHPFDWLDPHDQKMAKSILRGPYGVQLLLRGTGNDLTFRWGPDHRCLEIGSGPCWPMAEPKPTVVLGRLLPGEKASRLYAWSFSDRDGGCWLPDSTFFVGMVSGVKTFTIPPTWTRGTRDTPELMSTETRVAPKEKGPLPIGTSDFQKIIANGYFYIDKTLMIRALWEADTVALIPRPRRFGKTINMEMLQIFFEITEEDKTHHFDGLAIHDDTEMMALAGTFPVISLTFKDVKAHSWALCLEQIARTLGAELERHGYLEPHLSKRERDLFDQMARFEAGQVDYERALLSLTGFLERFHGTKVIVLIDEYDTPLLTAHHHGYLDECLGFLRNLFSATFKSNRSLEKGVLTGVMRVARESVFSGLNNVTVYGLFSEPFADYFGFTGYEVRKALELFELEPAREDVARWYDGYYFGGQHIYNPWSFLSYLKNRAFGTYWINTSDNNLVRDLITKGDLDIEEDLSALLHGETITCRIREDIAFRDMRGDRNELWSFLTFTGYLTPEATSVTGDHVTRLLIPNQEVRRFFDETMEQWLTAIVRADRVDALTASLLKGDLAGFETLLQALVLEIMSFHDTGEKRAEGVYHAFVLGLLAHLRNRYQIRSNRESGLGRYDIMLIPENKQDTGIILEFKSVAANRREHAGREALDQIRDLDYARELKAQGFARVLEVGIAFAGKQVVVNGEARSL